MQNLLSDCNSCLSHVGGLWWCNLFLETVRDAIRGFIVIDGNQIANFETKTTSLISKFDSKFANFASKLEKQL